MVPVILFHAGFEWFEGGYLGVDVFFVVSGYLITTIILKEMTEGQFSLINFYERRARRILPALFFVAFVSLIAAYFVLSPRYMREFALSLIAVATFSSNILFWLESGYFDTAAELKPLLHTWSLAVEEQYYILFPLLMMATWRLGLRSIVVLTGVLFTFSLALAQWATYNFPEASFFLLLSRGWEIWLGAFCAFHLWKRDIPNDWRANLFSAVGLTLIVASMLTYNQSVLTPSLYTLLPTCGVALVILFTGEKGLVTRFLGNRCLVGLGLISYSAYLWHQPIFSFFRHFLKDETTTLQMVSLSLLSLVIGYFSWKWIETPFRNRDGLVSRSGLFILSGTAAVLLICVGVFFATKIEKESSLKTLTENSVLKTFPKVKSCRYEKTIDLLEMVEVCYKSGKTVYLVGDSHADALSSSLSAALKKSDTRLITLIHNRCLLIEGTTSEQTNDRCTELKDFLPTILKRFPGTVVMSSRWRIYLMGNRFNNEEGGVESGKNLQHFVTGEKGTVFEKVENKLAELSSIVPLIIVGQIPEAGWHVPDEMIHRRTLGVKTPLTTSFKVYKSSNTEVFELFDRLGSSERISVVRTADLVCSDVTERCLNELDGLPLYHDDVHPFGALVEMINDQIIDLVLPEKMN